VPAPNRVTPTGEIVAIAQRGLFLGNRGCIHDAPGHLARRWQVRRWITCALRYKDWRAPMWEPRRWTALFFWDEAVALAAGHRPCALCRRADYDRLVAVWRELHPDDAGADAIDARLHAERLEGRARRLHAPAPRLPDGAFVLRDGEPWLVRGGELLRWTVGGYAQRAPRRGDEELLTPPSLVELLRRGWDGLVPLLHPSASVNCAG
jgi:hypothetical protein